MHRQKMQVESRQAKHRPRNRDGGVQYCDVNWFCDSFTNSKLIFYWLLGQMCHEGCYRSILNTCDIAPSHSEGTTVRKKEELVTCMI